MQGVFRSDSAEVSGLVARSVTWRPPSGGPWLFSIFRAHVRNVKVSLQGASTPHITGPAVEAASQRIGEADAHRDGGDAQLLEHLDDAGFMGLNQHSLGVQHQNVHGQPLG